MLMSTSVKTLESQITDLESEASRLLRALDSAKEAKSDVERTEKKRADEAAKELAVQVRSIILCIWQDEADIDRLLRLSISGRGSRSLRIMMRSSASWRS